MEVSVIESSLVVFVTREGSNPLLAGPLKPLVPQMTPIDVQATCMIKDQGTTAGLYTNAVRMFSIDVHVTWSKVKVKLLVLSTHYVMTL